LSDAGVEAARYVERTGREISRAALALYQMRWDLDDVGLLLADFRAPHGRNGDTEVGWAGLEAAVQRLALPGKIS
jgi:spectinomycin phosphotransferase